MRKRFALVLALALVVAAAGLGAATAAPPDGDSGMSHVSHLTLFEKNANAEWAIVEGGAHGQLAYTNADTEFGFNFNGFGLDKGVEYTLIYYADPWPGTGGMCLGFDAANGGGNVHILGSENTGDLPVETDTNDEGAKIWLVLSDDVACDTFGMIGWNPDKYLFENNLISFLDTDTDG